MRKILPWIFPFFALGLVGLLTFRWYTLREELGSRDCYGYECSCIEDCKEMGGVFKRYISMRRAPAQCICKLDEEIKNIW